MFKTSIILSLAMVIVMSSYALAQGGLDQRVSELSQQIAKEMTEYQKTTIAVVEFSDLQGNVTDFGRFLAEKLITRLYQTKKFKVIERQLLKKVISEQKLSLTGMVDPTSAKQLGKILGVDAICSGSITDLAQSLDVNARLISTETGEIFAVASTEIFKDESVMRLMAAGATTPTAPLTSSTPSAKRIVRAGKDLAPGMKFDFQDKVIEIKTRSYQYRVRLASIEISQGNHPSMEFELENLSEETTLFAVRSGTNIVDQSGNYYPFKSSTVIPREYNSVQIQPNQKTKFFVKFDKIPVNTSSITVTLLFTWPGGDVIFSDLQLN